MNREAPLCRRRGVIAALLCLLCALPTGCASAPKAQPAEAPSSPSGTAPSVVNDALVASEDERRLLAEGSPEELAVKADAVKRALIVAVGDYDEATGWRDINAGNDVPLIEAALLRQGFPPENIRVLRDAEATRTALEAAFREHLIEGASPGDVLVFHYSGHGQQITDQDGDEVFDGYDEALVPVDAHAAPSDAYAGEAHLRDDTLGGLLDEARAAIGADGHLLVLLDSCYSGSSSRGVGEAQWRSADGAFGPPGARSADAAFEGGGGIFAPRTARAPEAMGSMVIISASRHDQKNHETTLEDGTPVGSLSLAFSTTLSAMDSPEMSYRALFSRLNAEMRSHVPSQQPQLEGDLDTTVLNGRAVPQQPYLAVTALRADKARLSGGHLAGVFEGARVELHPVGTVDPSQSQAAASGVITTSSSFSAVARFDEALGGELPDADALWAFVITPGFPPMTTRLLLVTEDSAACPDCALSEAQAQQARGDFSSMPMVELTEGPLEPTAASERAPELAVLGHPRGYAIKHLPTDRIVQVVERTRDIRSTFSKEVLKYQRARYLIDLNPSSGSLRMKSTLRRARVEYDDFGGCSSYALLEAAEGADTFEVDEGFAVEVENVGDAPAYLTVLYIAGSGDIAQLFPNTEGSADNIVEPGAKVVVGPELCWTIGPPASTDFIKVFASKEPLEFSGIITSEGLGARAAGELSLMEHLMVSTFEHRGPPRSTRGRQESVSAETLTLEIVEP